MTDRELLLSPTQKIDRNHKWIKRQFGAILRDMAITHNVVRKNHYYLHEIFDRTWAIMSRDVNGTYNFCSESGSASNFKDMVRIYTNLTDMDADTDFFQSDIRRIWWRIWYW